jgi:hypothetical protein
MRSYEAMTGGQPVGVFLDQRTDMRSKLLVGQQLNARMAATRSAKTPPTMTPATGAAASNSTCRG